MKINQKILSIPPYVSTAWKNVVSLHLEGETDSPILVIGLFNGAKITIPNLERSVIEGVFASHQKFLEQENGDTSNQKQPPTTPPPMFPPGFIDDSSLMSMPLNFGIQGDMGNLLQHNPESSDSPDLPDDVLEKISAISKAVGFDSMENFPKPEPHCNCMHCQIMRKVHGEEKEETLGMEVEEEEVTEEDLKFRDWEIVEKGDNLYLVTNPLSREEHYTVFLGKPVGCTCGNPNCEHIRSVLNS